MAELTSLKKPRKTIVSKITRINTYVFEKFTAESNLAELQIRNDELTKKWELFQEIQNQIDEIETEIDEEYCETVETKYYTTAAQIKTLIQKGNSNNQAPQFTTNTQNDAKIKTNLPRLEIPFFEGNYQQWRTFYEIFMAVIHNDQSLSNIEKFSYLKSRLRGEPLKIIEGVSVCGDTYLSTLDLLIERYDNQYLLTNSHLKALFELSAVSTNNISALRNLIIETKQHLRSIQSLKVPIENWDPIIIFMLTQKLDNATKLAWELHKPRKDQATLNEFYKFIEERCISLESVNSTQQKQNTVAYHQQSKPYHQQIRSTKSMIATNYNKQCSVCNDKYHRIYYCPKFLQLPYEEKMKIVKQLNLCTNCLRQGHNISECYAAHCSTCNKKHNTLLHNQQSDTQNVTTLCSQERAENNGSIVLLSTAIVHIKDVQGQPVKCRAVLDSGSQSHFITQDLVRRLQLPKRKIKTTINGIASSTTASVEQTTASISSINNNYKATINCLIMPKIMDKIPTTNINKRNFKIPNNINLADPTFNISGEIDLLIGADIFFNILTTGQYKTTRQQPVLQNTHLGWIIAGNIPDQQNSSTLKSSCFLTYTNDLSQQIERFWVQEEPTYTQHFSKEEQICEQNYEKTVMQDETGRYIVNLPFKDNQQLGQSYEIALRRLLSVERKLRNEKEARKEYCNFMKEYEQLGHMTLISNNDTAQQTLNFLPHHAVIKESSTTTKVRVVFDGSCKTNNGIALNDILMAGPTIQQDLFSILIRFRLHKYVITADIEKMYRQVFIKPEDRKYQNILWRHNDNDNVNIYQLNTVTYGTTSGPYLAIRTLFQVAKDYGASYPQAASIIQRDFYVDDLLTGASTIEQVKTIRDEITELLAHGLFNIRKWRTNEPKILQQTENQAGDDIYRISKEDVQKTLGLYWDSKSDQLLFTITQVKLPMKLTKRHILSSIAKIYDPLGLIGPVLTNAKLIMQQLWQMNVDWDEELPISIINTWKTTYASLSELNHLKLNRHVNPNNTKVNCEIHGFADASNLAYGACVYFKFFDDHNSSVTLLCSKSRVAPLKSVSLPRLELCGTLLLAHLIHKLIDVLFIDIQNIYCWSDSTIALNWIKTEPCKLKTYVANRVSEIQQLIPNVIWRHIPTDCNPADVISRGMTANNLIHCDLWWNGPPWLKTNETSWPELYKISPEDESIINNEHKRDIQMLLATITTKNQFLEKYSSFFKLQRITAYILRFINICRKQASHNSTQITYEEMQAATQKIIFLVQQQHFQREFHDLTTKNAVSKDSKLRSLNPYLDDTGLIRVGGRIHYSKVNQNQKHPIVLPQHHHVTSLIIKETHESRLHCGAQALLCYVRLKYWPLGGKTLCKKLTRQCIKCFKAKPIPGEHIMGNLPTSRTTLTRPFATTGVDYCGPFNLKEFSGRGRPKIYKVYLSIFVCFAIKAVHIEIVRDLTSEAFIAAVRRFTSRRGLPSDIYSDNGTNFTKTNKDLKDLYTFLNNNQSDITSDLTKQSIKWHFIPPRSPHIGGLWEAAVKSTKTHLKRILNQQLLTYEHFNTLIIQIESCLNSRPLTPLTDDPNDFDTLTPAHFLIGTSLLSPLETSHSNDNENILSKWQHIQKMRQAFWKRWSLEYLHTLQQRSKWKDHQNNINVGTLVLLIEDNIPPQRWVIGRIVQVFPGDDSVVRVVLVKTKAGLFKRSIKRVCPLPVQGQ